jgi:hypothetical protein
VRKEGRELTEKRRDEEEVVQKEKNNPRQGKQQKGEK